MKLLTLALHNFKGVRDFTLMPDGESLDVFGDNATGKTTLSDALHWLLFDKDSEGRKDFTIKTTTPDGEAFLYGKADEKFRNGWFVARGGD